MGPSRKSLYHKLYHTPHTQNPIEYFRVLNQLAPQYRYYCKPEQAHPIWHSQQDISDECTKNIVRSNKEHSLMHADKH